MLVFAWLPAAAGRDPWENGIERMTRSSGSAGARLGRTKEGRPDLCLKVWNRTGRTLPYTRQRAGHGPMAPIQGQIILPVFLCEL